MDMVFGNLRVELNKIMATGQTIDGAWESEWYWDGDRFLEDPKQAIEPQDPSQYLIDNKHRMLKWRPDR